MNENLFTFPKKKETLFKKKNTFSKK
jgi:hypothetical protein